jgi:hypothetical protein
MRELTAEIEMLDRVAAVTGSRQALALANEAVRMCACVRATIAAPNERYPW